MSAVKGDYTVFASRIVDVEGLGPVKVRSLQSLDEFTGVNTRDAARPILEQAMLLPQFTEHFLQGLSDAALRKLLSDLSHLTFQHFQSNEQRNRR